MNWISDSDIECLESCGVVQMSLRVEFHKIETFIQVNKKNKIRTVLENMNISQNLETQV